MTLERLEAGIPIVFYSWLCHDPLRLFFLKKPLYQATGRTKHERRCVYLKRALLYCPLKLHYKSAGIVNVIEQYR